MEKKFFNERAFFSEIITEQRVPKVFKEKKAMLLFDLFQIKHSTLWLTSSVHPFTPLRNSFFCFDKVIMVDYYTRTYLLKYFFQFFFLVLHFGAISQS